MNREDIIRMAEESGAIHYWHLSNLERFAALVAAAEREACASALEKMQIVGTGEHGFLERSTIKDCAETIRARGQA